ncbi:hypothetical protein HG530_001879 [Fusarium avenaceum]|nr:hypothetical protein HG530_001879 [Fusarium avenaceum]
MAGTLTKYLHSLVNIAESGLVVLDGTVDVPGDDGFLAILSLVGCDETKTAELGLVKGLSDQRCGIHLLAPLQSLGKLLLRGNRVIIVGAEELLENNFCRDMIDVGELDTPHFFVLSLAEDVIQTSIELGQRCFGG